jgi:hypothetical protein
LRADARFDVSDSFGDGSRAIATPVTGTAPLRPRFPDRDRTRPEERDRWYRVGRHPFARTCGLQGEPANGRRRQNARPSAGLQRDFGSDDPESACIPGVSSEPPTIGRPRVRFKSDRAQTHLATAPTKKTCKCRPFLKRLKGFEPSTFCMASGTRAPRSALNDPAKEPFFAPAAACRKARHSSGNHGGFRTETGPSMASPSPRIGESRRWICVREGFLG